MSSPTEIFEFLCASLDQAEAARSQDLPRLSADETADGNLVVLKNYADKVWLLLRELRVDPRDYRETFSASLATLPQAETYDPAGAVIAAVLQQANPAAAAEVREAAPLSRLAPFIGSFDRKLAARFGWADDNRVYEGRRAMRNRTDRSPIYWR